MSQSQQRLLEFMRRHWVSRVLLLRAGAQPTFKKTFGFAPMCAFVDHGEQGTGEVLALDLRPGKASPFDKTSHLETLDHALAQLPEQERRQVLVRTDTGGCSKAFLHHIIELRW